MGVQSSSDAAASTQTPVNLVPGVGGISDLLDIGKPILLDTNADRGSRISNKVLKYMNKMDIIPITWSINYPIKNNGKSDRAGGIKIDYDAAIKEYQGRCFMHDLISSYKGVRVWTSTDIQYQESFTNSYENNVLESSINEMNSKLSTMRNFVKSVGYDTRSAEEMAVSTVKVLGDKFNVDWQKLTNQSQTARDALSPAIDLAKNIIIHGKQMSLPKIWQSSNYTPSLQVTIKLISPYGSPKAIKEHIVRPLLHLLLLFSPSTDDGLTYGNVGYVQVLAYGSVNINVGIVTDIQISRAGPDITYNKYQQPLSVTMTLSITPAVTGFSCLANNELKGSAISINSIEQASPISLTAEKPVFGMTTTNDIIKSFQKMPGTTSELESFTSSLTNPIKSLSDSVKSTISEISSNVQSTVNGAIEGMSKAGNEMVGDITKAGSGVVGDVKSKIKAFI